MSILWRNVTRHLACQSFQHRSWVNFEFVEYVSGITVSYYHTKVYLDVCKISWGLAMFVLFKVNKLRWLFKINSKYVPVVDVYQTIAC